MELGQLIGKKTGYCYNMETTYAPEEIENISNSMLYNSNVEAAQRPEVNTAPTTTFTRLSPIDYTHWQDLQHKLKTKYSSRQFSILIFLAHSQQYHSALKKYEHV